MNVTFVPALLVNTAVDDMRKREYKCVFVYAAFVFAVYAYTLNVYMLLLYDIYVYLVYVYVLCCIFSVFLCVNSPLMAYRKM